MTSLVETLKSETETKLKEVSDSLKMHSDPDCQKFEQAQFKESKEIDK